MKLIIDFDPGQFAAVFDCSNLINDQFSMIKRVLNDSVDESIQYGQKIFVPWQQFLAVRLEIVKFAMAHHIDVSLTDKIKPLLEKADGQTYSLALSTGTLNIETIKEKLQKIGFERELTDNQLNNLSQLGPLPAGATFSVPGAGKTTEALAYFFLNATSTDCLLVVAPINAFGSWEEQLCICVPSEKQTFVRLRGGEKNIEKELRKAPRYMLITYQQYPRVKELIQKLLIQRSCFMFLDESHRIKSGKNSVSADAILSVSYLPKQKLIMSGTPMPQSVKDLIPQIKFLYPEIKVTEETAVDLLQPIYVRTTKDQLGIPPMQHRLVSLEMDPLQREIYQALKSETKRQLMPFLSDRSRSSLRKIGNCIIKMMQFVSNPALLAKDVEYAFDSSISELLSSNNGPKIEYACQRAHQLASQGKKVIIWSSFVENVELIATRLADLGADFIHGGVDAGDEEDSDTREWKIKEFHNNPNKYVLVANPAAASEGISLHTVCQYALYVDRTFNAAHYLQSEDRIHRLGLRPDQVPCAEIIECEDTIDQVIRQRLLEKVEKMSAALNDQSLNVDVIPYDFEFDEEGNNEIGSGDVDAILQYFFGGTEE